MAAMVQQPPQTQEGSAARAFWNAKMQEHPNIAGGLALVGEVAGFFLNGHFIVAASRWVIRVGGYVAESALLFAVLWVSGTSVAPDLIELVMSAKTMQSLVSVALIVLALIPEIVLANAIINAAGHWLIVVRDRHNIMAWVWALAFTIPTLLFLYLTAYTLNTLAANNGNFVQASAGMIGLRCFAGWTYGLLEMVYAGVGRRTLNQVQLIVTPAQPAPAAAPIDYAEIARQLLPLVAQEVRQAVPDTTGMVEQLQQANSTVIQELRSEISLLSEQVVNLQAAQSAPISEPESEPECDPQIVQIEDYFEGPAEEPFVTPSKAPKVTRQLTAERPSKKPAQGAAQNGRGEAQQKALRILKRTPDIGPTELSKRANVSLSSAKRILATATAK